MFCVFSMCARVASPLWWMLNVAGVSLQCCLGVVFGRVFCERGWACVAFGQDVEVHCGCGQGRGRTGQDQGGPGRAGEDQEGQEGQGGPGRPREDQGRLGKPRRLRKTQEGQELSL